MDFPRIVLVVVLTMLVPLQGCSWMFWSSNRDQPTVGKPVFVEGELRALKQTPYDQVWEATKATTRALDFQVTRQEQGGLTGEIQAITAHNEPVRIDLIRLNPSETRMTIRIGAIGDKERSNLILNHIEARL